MGSPWGVYMEKALNREEVLKKIKGTILSTAEKYGIEIDKVILFGSRARRDFTEESDWDILIVTKSENKNLYKFLKDVKINLSIKMRVPNDIIIITKKYYEEKKHDVGSIGYYAAVEGKVL